MALVTSHKTHIFNFTSRGNNIRDGSSEITFFKLASAPMFTSGSEFFEMVDAAGLMNIRVWDCSGWGLCFPH